ncbi:uncharacterized protein LOC135086390 [Ostrinia nubilalis]|uniref:uncharacterized protein LOC135086390 n=1 Tax=Ostrinia nubilalis TaxID=29057 RepID=UPI0030822C04
MNFPYRGSDFEYYCDKKAVAKRHGNKREDIDSEEETSCKRLKQQRPRKTAKHLFDDSEDESVNKPLKQKPRKTAKHLFDDSEEESVNKPTKSSAKKSSTKRKSAESSSGDKRTRASGWKLDLDDDADVESSRARSQPGRLQSVLTRRVADGVLRRTASLPGDLFVELRLYNADEIRAVQPKDRWEKAVLSLKYQSSSNAEHLDLLRQFVTRAREAFEEDGMKACRRQPSSCAACVRACGNSYKRDN